MPPGNVKSRYGVYGVGVNLLESYHQVSPGTGVSEDDRPAQGPTDIRIRRILKNLFDLLFRDPMVRTMLHISFGVVIKIPDNRIKFA